MSLGVLILRVVVGLVFAGHGLQKLFGWFGGGRIEGTSRMVGSLGYRPARAFAVLNGLGEALGGMGLAFGFLTPLASVAMIAVMVNAIGAVHLKNGLWNQKGGFELPLVYSTVALAVAFVGPGRYSIDRMIGVHLAGAVWGVLAGATGLIVGLVVLATRRPPEADATEEGNNLNRAA